MGKVEDILLRFAPGVTTETVGAITCPGGITAGKLGASGWWSMFFFGAHSEEAAMTDLVSGSGLMPADLSGVSDVSFLFAGWDVPGGELFAEREWERSVEGITEHGSFKLYHRPQ